MDAVNTELPFWEQPLDTLDRAQWEALCDGCGKCCLLKAEDEDDGKVYMTNIACKLLDTQSARCSDYRRRRYYVPDCIRLTRGKLDQFTWLPDSCAYKMRARNLPLPEWHYLVSGDRETIHETGNSIRGKVITEVEAGPIEQHILDRPL
ncbi:YcgN family cysteine cluster protein [Sphingorhabdus sp. EL138]|uniref:YcgN family cysteine cluster protein n=1 Tax=Sphingorhabdus sp. EL138 TaxID=2073156 RepID=UPI000D695930|nr:YcgN family cysteine cluster protein [Sphingorhabdus sp. EL138]